jgi:DNA repair protein RecO (recombination protein O)
MARARVYGSEAIALKRMDFGEADRIVTVLTPGYGKFRCIAKGVRKSTNRLSGFLEPFAHVHLMLAHGRELDVVTQAATIAPFRELRDDLVRSSHAYHLAELVDGFLQDRDEHRSVFSLLGEALAALAGGAIAPDLVARHFEIHLLAAVGFRPELVTCLKCPNAIAPGANGYSPHLGGVVCPACTPTEESARRIPTDTLKLLRLLQRTSSVADLHLTVASATLSETERLMRVHLELLLERRLRATEFVHHVREAAAGYEG